VRFLDGGEIDQSKIGRIRRSSRWQTSLAWGKLISVFVGGSARGGEGGVHAEIFLNRGEDLGEGLRVFVEEALAASRPWPRRSPL